MKECKTKFQTEQEGAELTYITIVQHYIEAMERYPMHRPPPPQLHLAMTLPPPVYFLILSFGRPLTLLAWPLIEFLGLADIDQRLNL